MKTIYNNQGTIPRKYTHRRAAAIPECVAKNHTPKLHLLYHILCQDATIFFRANVNFFRKQKNSKVTL